MTDGHSITIWVEKVKGEDGEAARRLWEQYFPRIVDLARKRLAGVPRKMEDEEDVALSVLDTFCRAAAKGRFLDLHDRKGLWRLLCRITHHKAVDLIRRTQTAMGDARVLGESRLVGSGTSVNGALAPLARIETAGDFAAVVADEMRRLLEMLPKEELRTVAVAKMEGYTNQQIAEQLGCAGRTIERYLQWIRDVWKKEDPDQA